MVYRRPVQKKPPTFVWMTLISVLCHVSENQLLRALGMLQAGLVQNIVGGHFGVHRNTIQSLLMSFRQSDNTRDRQRSGRPRVTSRQQDNHIRLVHLRDRFQTSNLTARSIPGLWPISSRTVHNRLRGRHIRPWRPAISVQCCCLGTVHLDWHGVDVIWDSEDGIGPISCLQMNPVPTALMADTEFTAT